MWVIQLSCHEIWAIELTIPWCHFSGWVIWIFCYKLSQCFWHHFRVWVIWISCYGIEPLSGMPWHHSRKWVISTIELGYRADNAWHQCRESVIWIFYFEWVIELTMSWHRYRKWVIWWFGYKIELLKWQSLGIILVGKQSEYSLLHYSAIEPPCLGIILDSE